RLAATHSVTAIALQVQQSLWRSCSSGPLDHEGARAPTDGDQHDLEDLRQSACNHITTEGPGDRTRVRTFVGYSLHFSSGGGGGDSGAVRAKDQSRNFHHGQGWRPAPLPGLEPEPFS